MSDGRDATSPYDEYYYAHNVGDHPYTREEPGWKVFYGAVADRIVREIEPRTALDAGCAIGFMVEALRERGVEAHGFDVSEWAIAQVPEEFRPFCRVGSILDPIERDYDLVLCIEVLEHLALEMADPAVANLCAHTDDIIFSSTPTDYREATHLNVRPAEFWAELFARYDFHHDVEYDMGYLTPWAIRFRRRRDPIPRVVGEYEREIWRLRTEAGGRNDRVLELNARVSEQDAEIERLKTELDEIERLKTELEEGGTRPGRRGISASTAVARRAYSFARRRLGGKLRKEIEGLRADLDRARRGLVAAAASHAEAAGSAALADMRILTLQAELDALRSTVDTATSPSVPPMSVEYQRWLVENEPDAAGLQTLRTEAAQWHDRPLISVIMPVFDPQRELLEEAIASVCSQSYDRWELCIANDGSTLAHVRDVLDAAAASDARIRVEHRAKNGGITEASATALQMASGDVVGFLDHDDVLRPQALSLVARFLADHREVGLVYSDEDKLLLDGTRGTPFFKPAWSPDLLLSNNYLNHFTAIRRELVVEAGGFRPGFDGSQDYDLYLRLVDSGCGVGHVPQVLYSWRQVPGSAALDAAEKPSAYPAAARALSDSLRRRGIEGSIEHGRELGVYVARYTRPTAARVGLIVTAPTAAEVLRECIERAAPAALPDLQVLVTVDDTCSADVLEWLRTTTYDVIWQPGALDRWSLRNRAAERAAAECLIFLDGTLAPDNDGWVAALVEQAMRPEIGCAGGRILTTSGHVVHEGVGLGVGGRPAADLDMGGYFALGEMIRDVSAVRGCLAVSREHFERVGGFSGDYLVQAGDIDMCARLTQRGYRVVYTPLALFRQIDGAPREAGFAADTWLLSQRLSAHGPVRDPYLSPHVVSYHPFRLASRDA